MANNLSQLDANQVLRSAYDDSLNRLRVDSSISASIGAVEVIIDHVDDSIRLGDGVSLVSTTTVNSKVGLDVNIVNASLPLGTGSTPLIANVLVPLAATESSQVIAAGTKRFTMKTDSLAEIKFAYIATTSGTTFVTIPEGASYEEQGLDLSSPITIYFQINKPGITVEFVFWS